MVPRICVVNPDTNEVAYCMAIVSVRGPSLPVGFLWAQKHLTTMKIDDVADWMAAFLICSLDFDK